MKRVLAVMCLMLAGCGCGPHGRLGPTRAMWAAAYKYEIVWETEKLTSRFYTDEILYRGWNCVEFTDKETGLRCRLVADNMIVYSQVAESGE